MRRRLALLMACAAAPAAAAPGDCLPDIVSVHDRSDQLRPMTVTLETRAKQRILRASGTIAAGSATQLGAAMAAERFDEIWFDSNGGDLAEGMRIGAALRAAGVVTRVPAGAACVGACAEAFLGGRARFVDGDGVIGFGAVPLSDPKSAESPAQRENAAARWAEQRADYYIRSGVSRGLLRLQLAVNEE